MLQVVALVLLLPQCDSRSLLCCLWHLWFVYSATVYAEHLVPKLLIANLFPVMSYCKGTVTPHAGGTARRSTYSTFVLMFVMNCTAVYWWIKWGTLRQWVNMYFSYYRNRVFAESWCREKKSKKPAVSSYEHEEPQCLNNCRSLEVKLWWIAAHMRLMRGSALITKGIWTN